MELFKNRLYKIELITSVNTLFFSWNKNHPDVDLEGFIEACSNFVGYGFEFNTKNILIDTRFFTYVPPPKFFQWLTTTHYNRFRHLGVVKVAYVTLTEQVSFMKSTVSGDEGFMLDYFDDMEEARNWLK